MISSDKVLVEKKPNILSVNQIVVFKKNKRLIAHRIVYIHPRKKYIVTKGDGNTKTDSKIKEGQILGEVKQVKRDGEMVHLNHTYLTQSSKYLHEIKKVQRILKKSLINYVFLKGLPTHLHINNYSPKHVYTDIDILTRSKDLKQTLKLCKGIGFNLLPDPLFLRTTQHSLQKRDSFIPIKIDLHIQIAFGFTKILHLNELLPDIGLIDDLLFENINKSSKFNIPENEPLLLYLLLHLFHHNFQGYKRMRLIHQLITKKKIRWNKFSSLVRKTSTKSIVQFSLTVVNKYFDTKIPLQYSKKNSSLPLRVLLFLLPPTNYFNRSAEAFKRLLLMIVFSNKSLGKKLTIVLSLKTLKYVYKSTKLFFKN